MYTKKKLLKLIAASIIAGGLTFTPNTYIFTDLPLTMSIAHAEIKTYTGVGESIISDRETLDIGKQGAKLQAIRNAQDQAGIFISSRSEVVNGKLAKDEIIAFTAGIVKISDDVKYEPIPLGDALGTIKYRATVLVTIDTDELEVRINQWLSKNAQDRSAITAQNNELNKTVDEIKKTNERIEKQIVNAKTPEDTAKIKEELKALDRDTLYAQKISEGNKLLRAGNHDGAINLYREAIALYPNDATIAYERLGDVYYNLKDYTKAIECYDRVTQMDSNYIMPYYKRGYAYCHLGDTEKAAENFQKSHSGGDMVKYAYKIEEYKKKLKNNPNDSETYFLRANAYREMTWELTWELNGIIRWKFDEIRNYDEIQKNAASKNALADYAKAIAINSNNFRYYIERAKLYYTLKEYNTFIEDLNKSIQLLPDGFLSSYHDDYYRCDNPYFLLGKYYEELGHKEKAIENLKLALKITKYKSDKQKIKYKIKELNSKK